MTARAVVSPTIFQAGPTPVVPLVKTAPIAGASLDFTAAGLVSGSIDEWFDNANGNRMTTVSGSPQVIVEGGRRFVRFDGKEDLMDFTVPMAQPRLIGIVARVREINTGSTPIIGSTWTEAGKGVILGAYGGNANQYLSAGVGLNAVPATPLNTAWHIWVVRINSTSSQLLIDGVVSSGNAGSNAVTGIRLGGTQGLGKLTAIDVQRLVVVPGAGTFDTSMTIYNELLATTV